MNTDPDTLNSAANALGRAARLSLLAALAVASLRAASIVPSDPAYVRSLDGSWRFKIESTGGISASTSDGDNGPGTQAKKAAPITMHAPAEAFQKLDYAEGSGWVDLKVPGNWEIAGHSPATYNQPDNASGFYRVWFEVPTSWQGRSVRLNLDGVQNGAQFWLNGQPVAVDEPSWGVSNYHEGGWTAFQVDLTPQVKFGGRNLLAIHVTKQTRSADLDSGDYFFLGGVHRTVTLFSVPQSHVSDVTVQTKLLVDSKAEVKVIVDVSGQDATEVAAKLDGVTTVGKIEGGRTTITRVISQPKLWSAEFPNLYTLELQLKDAAARTTETISKRIGLREVTIRNAVFLVNGKPVKLAGICRHDVSPTEGTAVGPELWRKDILLMKAANINAIRTSHYPYGSGFYDLCDELGMYVVDELPYCWCPTNTEELQPAFEQRARETVRRDKNHPCVLAWAVGNENKEGRNLRIVADLVKQLDPTLPRAISWFDHSKGNTELSDSHYTVPDRIVQSAEKARANGHPHIYLENPNTWDIRMAADGGAWERWGTVLQRVWDACVRSDTIPGTFLWEWQDRAVVDASPVKNYVFFPDTGIHLLKVKGIVDGFRNPRPWYYEVKMVYSPVRVGDVVKVTGANATFDVENRYSFTDLSLLKVAWALEKKGGTVASGQQQITCAPLSRGSANLVLPAASLAEADALRVEFHHPNGNQVVAHRFVLKAARPSSRLVAGAAAIPLPQFNLVTRVNEKDQKAWRRAIRTTFQLTDVALEPAGATRINEVRSLTANVRGDSAGPVVGRVQATFAAGEWRYKVEWTGPEVDVQELGWRFEQPRDRERFSWDRAARWSVYPDRHSSRASGTATPESMNVPVTRMNRADAFDFNGTKYDCNWASLTDAAGKGLRVEFAPNQRFHCRAGLSDDGKSALLFVHQQVSPPIDISKNVVIDYYLILKPGSSIEGAFRVGGNEAIASN